MEAEDETDMVFDRSQIWKVDNENIKLDSLQALELSGEDYLRKDDSGNETCNLSKIQNVLQNMLSMTFVSKPTFNSWWEGHCHKRFDKGNMDIVKSFVRKYEFNKEYFMQVMIILSNHGDGVLSRLRVFSQISLLPKKAVTHYIFFNR